jgi:hypothetical protein
VLKYGFSNGESSKSNMRVSAVLEAAIWVSLQELDLMKSFGASRANVAPKAAVYTEEFSS